MLLATIFKQKEIYKYTNKCIGLRWDFTVNKNYLNLVVYIPNKLVQILNSRIHIFMKPEYKFFAYDFNNGQKYEVSFEELIPIFREYKEIKEFNTKNNLNINLESLN